LKFQNYFSQSIIPLIENVRKLPSNHYINVPTDPLGGGCGSLWIHGAHYGNH